MKRLPSALAFVLGLSLTGACGDDDGDGESLAALCQRACTTGASIDCPADDASTCVSDCQGADEIPEPCRSLARTALECAVERPASDWACDEEGSAVLNQACGEEGRALLACVVGEDGTCPFEDDDECDDPTGTNVCPAGTDLADCS
jgi:hypothetical protein